MGRSSFDPNQVIRFVTPLSKRDIQVEIASRDYPDIEEATLQISNHSKVDNESNLQRTIFETGTSSRRKYALRSSGEQVDPFPESDPDDCWYS